MAETRSLFARPIHLLAVLWFLIHIPTTLLVDIQSILPQEYAKDFPQFAKDMLQFHIKAHGDHLVRDNPLWFVTFVWCEVCLQLPFFFIAAYAYIAGRSWIRIPAIMYGVHAATTVLPMLAEFAYSPEGAANPKKQVLLAMYGAYAVVPMLLALNMALCRVPFPAAKKKKTA
ncbi:MAG: transmembrane protein 6/97 [Monoraphidium minutum]|nr:MAG: transmembrane protein 6/97 [Monoraphidium minutum]